MRVAEFFGPKSLALPPIESRSIIGGNNPPGPIEMAESIMQVLSDFMAEHPVIQTDEDARAAKPLIDRAKAAMDELEAERDGKVRPLNEQVAQINAEYKTVHNTDPKKPGTFNRVFNELKARIADYLRREEQKRLAAAAEARRIQEEAERQAREAEQREAEALANAQAGEVVDIAVVTKQADEAFSTFERQSRFADRAERDTKVKLAGGFGSSVGLRNAETLQVDDALKAIVIIGVTDRIRDAILTEARAYRKANNGRLPEGVSATTERKL